MSRLAQVIFRVKYLDFSYAASLRIAFSVAQEPPINRQVQTSDRSSCMIATKIIAPRIKCESGRKSSSRIDEITSNPSRDLIADTDRHDDWVALSSGLAIRPSCRILPGLRATVNFAVQRAFGQGVCCKMGAARLTRVLLEKCEPVFRKEARQYKSLACWSDST